jgi:hypothetical protein
MRAGVDGVFVRRWEGEVESTAEGSMEDLVAAAVVVALAVVAFAWLAFVDRA